MLFSGILWRGWWLRCFFFETGSPIGYHITLFLPFGGEKKDGKDCLEGKSRNFYSSFGMMGLVLGCVCPVRLVVVVIGHMSSSRCTFSPPWLISVASMDIGC
jgi:hypothetical protein